MTTRPIPEHGTRACYLRGCRRPECTTAHVRYCKRHKYQTHLHGPVRISVAAAEQHVQQLAADGWTRAQIAQAAGCSDGSIQKILNRRQKTITPENAAKILAANPANLHQAPARLIPSTGFLRRGRALEAIAHSNQDIARALGMNPACLSRLLIHEAPTIKAETALSMTALYDQWKRQPGTSKRTATTAKQRGWHAPDAWDDIDDPTEDPTAVIRLNVIDLNEERKNEVRLLASAGNTFEVIAKRIGISPSGVRKILANHHPNLYLELTA